LSLGNIFCFYKTKLDTFCYQDSVKCTMPRAVVLTQYRYVSDGRTDGQTDRQTELL